MPTTVGDPVSGSAKLKRPSPVQGLTAGRHDMGIPAILVLNAGSSSLKFAFYDAEKSGRRLSHGAVADIGTNVARFSVTTPGGAGEVVRNGAFPDHRAALDAVISAVDTGQFAVHPVAVGHRVAHGGPDCDCPSEVTPELLQRIRALVPLAPLHLPANIAGIEAITALHPDLPQVASFDTAFHNGLPRVARMTGLPRAMETPGLRRYGYHGLSYEYIVGALRQDGVDVETERLVVAHLGNGASLAAIRGGRSIETTMGFSPLSGVPMGTRSGDIDPGLILHLLREAGMSAEDLETLLQTGSGLLGLSGESRDMRVLIERHDAASGEAIRYFCYHVRRHLAALTAPLEGLDRLVFTGGIGANAAPVRELVCAGLEYLGIRLDHDANAGGRRTISEPDAGVIVEVRQTDEEEVIADHVLRLCPDCASHAKVAS
ncbi:acetate/propionate family kinase [Thalassococcus profundi]|uniref:acetate/propionate family kinase n=1 Tax=Thalassococcus profundi TaxID=2282382 RepID=UPI004059BCFB